MGMFLGGDEFLGTALHILLRPQPELRVGLIQGCPQ